MNASTAAPIPSIPHPAGAAVRVLPCTINPGCERCGGKGWFTDVSSDGTRFDRNCGACAVWPPDFRDVYPDY